MCSCDVGEYPEFSTSEWRRAGRVRPCDDCTKPIPLGDYHKYGFGVFEGISYEWRRCARCDALARAHTAASATFGEPHCHAPIGELLSTIRECGDENPKYTRALRAEFRKLRARAA